MPSLRVVLIALALAATLLPEPALAGCPNFPENAPSSISGFVRHRGEKDIAVAIAESCDVDVVTNSDCAVGDSFSATGVIKGWMDDIVGGWAMDAPTGITCTKPAKLTAPVALKCNFALGLKDIARQNPTDKTIPAGTRVELATQSAATVTLTLAANIPPKEWAVDIGLGQPVVMTLNREGGHCSARALP